jgi:hypothetical protein
MVWHCKTVSTLAKSRIFRACVLSVLLYGSEAWLLTVAQERCLGDRISNEQLLRLTGQPCFEDIIRRNRLPWFGHVNRMTTTGAPQEMARQITNDLDKYQIRN